MISLPSDDIEELKKRNRAKKLMPKKHKIVHESGKSTKNLWRIIVEGARTANTKSNRANNNSGNLRTR